MKTEEGREIWIFLLYFHASVPEQELILKPRTKSSTAATAGDNMLTIAIELAFNSGLWKKIFTLKVLKMMPRGALKI